MHGPFSTGLILAGTNFRLPVFLCGDMRPARHYQVYHPPQTLHYFCSYISVRAHALFTRGNGEGHWYSSCRSMQPRFQVWRPRDSIACRNLERIVVIIGIDLVAIPIRPRKPVFVRETEDRGPCNPHARKPCFACCLNAFAPRHEGYRWEWRRFAFEEGNRIHAGGECVEIGCCPRKICQPYTGRRMGKVKSLIRIRAT